MSSAPQVRPVEMPFGRYRGRPITEIDDDYLEWLLTDCQSVNNEFRAVLEAEEQRRHGSRGKGIIRKPAENLPDKALCAEILRMGFLQKLTTIHTKAEADAATAAVDYIRRELGL